MRGRTLSGDAEIEVMGNCKLKIANCKLQIEERRRHGMSHWGVLAFLLIFVALLLAVSYWFLFPALAAAQNATEKERHRLGAYAWLLLALVLFILFVAMTLIFRLSRFFLPRKSAPRTETPYVDAWAESAKRMDSSPPREE